MAEEYRACVRIAKAHANKGKVVVRPVRGLPLLLQPGMEVALVPPALKGSRYHTVLEVEDEGADTFVTFEGVDDRDTAEALLGKTVLVRTCDLPDNFAELDKAGIVGREAFDEARELTGEIVEVVETPANDAWVLSTPLGEIVIPVIESCVSEIPPEGVIPVSIPNGIIEE